MSECKFCKKQMVNAHPNKIFCSNKGRQNCKDLYNNRLPNRIEAAKHYSGHNAKIAAQERTWFEDMYYINSDDLEDDDDPSWDSHKDY